MSEYRPSTPRRDRELGISHADELNLQPITDAGTYDAFAAHQPRARFVQSWGWGAFQERLGHRVVRLGITQGGALVSTAQLIAYVLPFGVRYWYCPQGPVVRTDPALAYGDVLRALREHVRDLLPAAFLRAEPLLPPDRTDRLRARGWRRTVSIQPQHTWVLDLSAPEDELRAAMHPKTRYNIGLAERKGVTVRSSRDADAVATFHAFVRSVNEREGIRSYSASYYRTMLQVLGDDGSAELLMAYADAVPIAGAILNHYGDTTTYNHGGSSDAHRNLMAPHLLQWTAIRRAQERGMRLYDFRGVAASDDPHDPWAGMTRFKKGFGGYPESLVGTWDYPIQRGQYALYRLGRRLLRNRG